MALADKQQFFFNRLALLVLWGCFCNMNNAAKPWTAFPKDTVAFKVLPVPVQKCTIKQVPVLCYHAIRESQYGDSPDQKAYSISPTQFEAQIKALADQGYATITPDELRDFWIIGHPLPEKPIMITFDDGRKEHFVIGARILEQYHFKGVFFIMTVTIGKKNYMSAPDIKTLCDRGHTIGSHTWDHRKVTSYKNEDWELQLKQPKEFLEKITGKPVTSFAYPYGVWNHATADYLKSHGFNTAFIVYGKQDATQPLYTIERISITNSGSLQHFTKIVANSGNK